MSGKREQEGYAVKKQKSCSGSSELNRAGKSRCPPHGGVEISQRFSGNSE